MTARCFRQSKAKGAIKAAVYAAAVAACVWLIYIGIDGLGASQSDQQAKVAKDAIVKAAVQCYALESRFPPGLAYLEENYGLALDHDKYIYHYRAIGSNMMPQIQIFAKDTGAALGQEG